jgi:hypothetical protein
MGARRRNPGLRDAAKGAPLMIGNVVRSRPSFLGAAMTAAAAYEAAKSAESNLNPKDYQQNPNFSDAAASAVIESGALPGNWSSPGGACSGYPAPNLNLFQTASGLALGTTGAGIGIAAAAHAISAAAAGAATAAIAGAGVVIAIVDMIIEHHKAAVRQEDQIYCAALPAAANAFAVIQQGVQSGALTPQQGMDGLDHLLSRFEEIIAPSYGHSPFCNALCEQKLMLDAYVRYWKGQYQAMVDAQAAAPPVAPPALAPATPAAPAATLTTPTTPRPAPTVSVPSAASGGGWLTQNSLLPFAPNWAVLALGAALLMGEI